MSRRGLSTLSIVIASILVISVVACVLGVLLIPCQSAEGYHSLSEPTEKVRAALTSAGVAASDVGTSFYGVACKDRVGRVHSYAIRESSVRLTVDVADASNPDIVGDELLRALQALDSVTSELKVASISFTARAGTTARAVLPFTIDASDAARSMNLRGAELINFLERR